MEGVVDGKMDAEFKMKLITALRSDEFKQTKAMLRDPNGAMCCLGVGCHLMGVEWFQSQIPGKMAFRLYGSDEEFRNFPPQVWHDMFGGGKVVKHLVKMNEAGQTFHQIADWIEQNIPIKEAESAS